MSKMMRTDRKPPLARSPIRLRSRRILHSNSNPIQTPPAPAPAPAPGTQMKTKLTNNTLGDIENSELRPEYHTISCEFRALAKMVNGQLGEVGNGFERGRFYDEYSARRNERLRRKKVGETTTDDKKTPYGLGVRKDNKKVLETMRKTIPLSTPMPTRRETPRYSLRSANKKPPPLASTNYLGVGSTRRSQKI